MHAGEQTTGHSGQTWYIRENLRVPDAAEAQSFFEEECPDDRQTLQPHQQAQARLSTGAGGLGLPSAKARRTSASIGSKVGILPEVLAGLTGPLGDRVRRTLPESRIIAQLGGSLRENRLMGGNAGTDGRNRDRILVGMGSRRRGGRGPKTSRDRHAGRA